MKKITITIKEEEDIKKASCNELLDQVEETSDEVLNSIRSISRLITKALIGTKNSGDKRDAIFTLLNAFKKLKKDLFTEEESQELLDKMIRLIEACYTGHMVVDELNRRVEA